MILKVDRMWKRKNENKRRSQVDLGMKKRLQRYPRFSDDDMSLDFGTVPSPHTHLSPTSKKISEAFLIPKKEGMGPLLFCIFFCINFNSFIPYMTHYFQYYLGGSSLVDEYLLPARLGGYVFSAVFSGWVTRHYGFQKTFWLSYFATVGNLGFALLGTYYSEHTFRLFFVASLLRGFSWGCGVGMDATANFFVSDENIKIVDRWIDLGSFVGNILSSLISMALVSKTLVTRYTLEYQLKVCIVLSMCVVSLGAFISPWVMDLLKENNRESNEEVGQQEKKPEMKPEVKKDVDAPAAAEENTEASLSLSEATKKYRHVFIGLCSVSFLTYTLFPVTDTYLQSLWLAIDRDVTRNGLIEVLQPCVDYLGAFSVTTVVIPVFGRSAIFVVGGSLVFCALANLLPTYVSNLTFAFVCYLVYSYFKRLTKGTFKCYMNAVFKKEDRNNVGLVFGVISTLSMMFGVMFSFLFVMLPKQYDQSGRVILRAFFLLSISYFVVTALVTAFGVFGWKDICTFTAPGGYLAKLMEPPKPPLKKVESKEEVKLQTITEEPKAPAEKKEAESL